MRDRKIHDPFTRVMENARLVNARNDAVWNNTYYLCCIFESFIDKEFTDLFRIRSVEGSCSKLCKPIWEFSNLCLLNDMLLKRDRQQFKPMRVK